MYVCDSARERFLNVTVITAVNNNSLHTNRVDNLIVFRISYEENILVVNVSKLWSSEELQ